MNNGSQKPPRKFLMRLAAALVLLGLYLVGAVAGAGLFLTSTASSAMAQRGRGVRRGVRGGGIYVAPAPFYVAPPLVVAPRLVYPARRRRRRRDW